jgi:hypothetical protein
MQERSPSTLEIVREEVIPLHPLEEHQQYEVNRLRESKNKSGKRNPET